MVGNKILSRDSPNDLLPLEFASETGKIHGSQVVRFSIQGIPVNGIRCQARLVQRFKIPCEQDVFAFLSTCCAIHMKIRFDFSGHLGGVWGFLQDFQECFLAI